MLNLVKYLFEPLMEYPLTFWMVTFAFVIESANVILRRDLVRMIPLSIRFLVLLGITAAMAPIAVEAFQALISNNQLPKTVEGVQVWPMIGFIGWVSFLSVSLTFLVFQLWEPWKEELLVKVPSKIVNYIGTGLLAGAIHSGSLCSFLFIYSYQRNIPIFSTEYVLLIGLGQVGLGLSLALLFRTKGANRFISDVLGLAVTGSLVFWVADYFGNSNPDWILWICAFSTFSWAFWGLGRFIREMVRFRRKEEGEALPPGEEEPPPGHVCPLCDREFVTFKGLRIHEGRMHKETVKA